jgi:copper chaperone CopZ
MTDTVTYDIQGMTCGGCQRALLAALKRAGAKVTLEDISLVPGSLKVSDGTPDAVVRTAVEAAGFSAGIRRER